MEIKFFKFEQKKSAEKPENEKKVTDVEKDKSWKEIIRQKYELSLLKLKESVDRLRKVRKIEEESGINTDEYEKKIIAEIKNISEEIKMEAPKKDYKKEKIAEKEEKEEKNNKEENIEKISFEAEGSPEEIIAKNIETEFFIDFSKDMLIEQASQKKYLEKLTLEFNGDKQKAIEEQAKRIKNIKDVNIVVFDNEEKFYKKLEELKNSGFKINGNIKEFKGIYVDDYAGDNQTIYSLRDNSFLAHELIHSETRGAKDISENAKKILGNSYLNQGFLNIFSGKDDEYFSHSAERLEGKKDLEFSLEILGIKKYDEPFTEEHYNKMMRAYKEGRIKGGARIFIERTKKEYFKKIFDEIAENKNHDETVVV